VMGRQETCDRAVLGRDRKQREPRRLDLLEQIAGRPESPCRNLDRALPERGGADDDDVLRILERRAGVDRESLWIVKRPEQRVRVEEQPQTGSASSP
jgi:hypothetical protein